MLSSKPLAHRVSSQVSNGVMLRSLHDATFLRPCALRTNGFADSSRPKFGSWTLPRDSSSCGRPYLLSFPYTTTSWLSALAALQVMHQLESMSPRLMLPCTECVVVWTRRISQVHHSSSLHPSRAYQAVIPGPTLVMEKPYFDLFSDSGPPPARLEIQ